jgi:hypothetical protein
MRRIALVIVLAAVLALAGCLGGGDGSDSAGTASSDSPGSSSSPQASADNGTADNETDDGPDFVWNTTTRQGSVTGLNVAGLALTTEGSDQNWTVRQGTRNLTLNLSAQSEEVTMRIAPPGCENTADSSCTTTVTTEDGEATWSTENPDTGQWDAVFFRGNTGYGEVQYELTIDKLVPAELLESGAGS